MNDSAIMNAYALDDFDWFLKNDLPTLPLQLAAKLSAMLKPIDRALVEHRAEIVHLEDGSFALRWEERHPEMLSSEEFCGRFFSAKQRDEFKKLKRACPSKHRELRLSRQQAYALLVAHAFTLSGTEFAEFEVEHEGLLNPIACW
jgi:hypothetical protein